MNGAPRLPTPTRRMSLRDMCLGVAPGAVCRAQQVPGTPVSALGERPVWAGAWLVWVDIDAGAMHYCYRGGGDGRGVPDAVATAALGRPVSFALPFPAHTSRPGLPTLVAATADGLVGVVARPGTPGSVALDFVALDFVTLRGGRSAGMPTGHRFNDGAFDRAGNLWVSSVSQPPGREPGSLWVASPQGDLAGDIGEISWTWREVVHEVPCGNGIAWSPDGSVMYLAESITRAIYAVDLAPGSRPCDPLGTPRVLVAWDKSGPMSGGPMSGGPMPDGMAMDDAGRLWVAMWDGGVVVCLDPADPWRAQALIETPTARPTAIALPPTPGTPASLTPASLTAAYITPASLTPASLTGASLTGAYPIPAYITAAGAPLFSSSLPPNVTRCELPTT